MIHKQVLGLTESPLFLVLDTAIPVGELNLNQRLPVNMFEIDGAGKISPVDYSIEAVDAERIGVDHLAKVKD